MSGAGFERLEDRYPELRDLATSTELGETRHVFESRLGGGIQKLEIEMGKLRSEVMAAMEAGFMRQQGTLLRWMSGLFLGQLAMVLAVVIALVQLLG